MSPIPTTDEMRPFYAGGYQKIPETLEELRSIAKKDAYRMKPILKYKSGGKLLEIGPWMGIFSCNAKDETCAFQCKYYLMEDIFFTDNTL